MIELFTHYPVLAKKIAHLQLCDLPTPVEPMKSLERRLGLDRLYVKRDDLTHPVFGGNKVRKLEFTLAEAQRAKAGAVITFGFAGSNHAAATAVHAKHAGLECTCMLMPQPNAGYLRQNLLVSHAHGADLRLFKNRFRLSLATMTESLKRGVKTGHTPYIIPPGGTSPLGVLGFINAAFELKRQIDEGILETPDRIYLPLGTAGTSIGLLIGMELVQLQTRLVPVRVVDHDFMNQKLAEKLFRDTVAFLTMKDPTMPKLSWEPGKFQIVDDFFGDGYAQFTVAGINAVKDIQETEGLVLDGSYSGKCMAALMAHGQKGELQGQRVLFWNTFNSSDLKAVCQNTQAGRLPQELQAYFTDSVQPLDPAAR